MSMSHGGHAGHMPATGDRKALVISGWLTGLYFIVELGIGIWTGSVAVMSDAFHTFSAVGGVIIISAVVIRFTGFLAIDPLLGMAFGLVLLWASWSILREALHILLQGTPEDLDLEAAIAAIRELEGVTDVHHVHAWSLTSGRNVFSSHVCVRDWQDGERVLRQVNDLLRDRFSIYFSTTQIEEYCLAADEGAAEIDITRSSTGLRQVTQGKPAEGNVHHDY